VLGRVLYNRCRSYPYRLKYGRPNCAQKSAASSPGTAAVEWTRRKIAFTSSTVGSTNKPTLATKGGSARKSPLRVQPPQDADYSRRDHADGVSAG